MADFINSVLWDHPRVGGEKFYVDEVLPGDTGSPPHGRGKVALAPASVPTLIITPAWAGKSRTCTGQRANTHNHPRMGGEKS